MYKVFLITLTDRSRLSLRRFAKGTCPLSPGQYSYHDASVPIGEGPRDTVCGDSHPHNDPRWPTHCGCGRPFYEDDEWQLFARHIYVRSDTGEETTLRDAPIGAVWDATWMAESRTYPNFFIGEDGRCLTVKTPGGDWIIDSRASNCTMPEDNTHKCWIRHGKPEDGTLHVDKNGHTCAAGAGSIMCGNYHGFLHNGQLTGNL